MATAIINIKTDAQVKSKAEQVFDSLGMSMSTAIDLFLRQTIRENGMPFSLKLGTPNQITLAAIEEGRQLARDPFAKGYSNMEELRKALEI